MADGFQTTVNDAGLLSAFRSLGDTALKYTKPASLVTAGNIEREAESRVRRSERAETAKGIQVVEMRNREGYVVMSVNRRMPNLPIWIEYGTQRGKPRSHSEPARPFFWPSVRLESGPHERRISDAISDAIKAEGLG